MFNFIKSADITQNLCDLKNNAIIVYGSSLNGVSKEGQACIRVCSNSYGIPLKLDDMNTMIDCQECFDIVKDKLILLWNKHKEGKEVILPYRLEHLEDNINICSPKIAKFIERFYKSAYDEMNLEPPFSSISEILDSAMIVNGRKLFQVKKITIKNN